MTACCPFRSLEPAVPTADDVGIGITGCNGRLPANGLQLDAIQAVPLDRWDADSPAVTAATGARFGGFVQDWSHFDAAVFGVSPSEAAVLDPQQRLLLEVC